MDIIYVGNDHTVEIQELRDDTGTLVSGASVKATLYQSDGITKVSGVTWPLTLVYTGSDGTYRENLPASVEIQEGQRYEMELTATFLGKQLKINRPVWAEKRN